MTKDEQNADKNNRKQKQQRTKTSTVNNIDTNSPAKATGKIDKRNVTNSVYLSRPQKIAESLQKDIRKTTLQSYSAAKGKMTSISKETFQSSKSTEQNTHLIQASPKKSKKKQKTFKDADDEVMIPTLDDRLRNEDIEHLDKKSLTHMLSNYKDSDELLLECISGSSSLDTIKSTILSIRDELIKKRISKSQEDVEMKEISKLEKIELEILDTCDEGAEKKEFSYLKGLFERYINESEKTDGSDGNLTKTEIIKSLLKIRDNHILPSSTSTWNEFKKKIINLDEENFKEISPTDTTVLLSKFFSILLVIFA